MHGGPSPIQNAPSFDNQPYTNNYNQPPYAQPGYDIEKSSRSGRSGGNGMPKLKSRPPAQGYNNNSPHESQHGYYNPKKFKEEDSFAAMQQTSLRSGRENNKRRDSRTSKSRSKSNTRNKDSGNYKKELKNKKKESGASHSNQEALPVPANLQ